MFCRCSFQHVVNKIAVVQGARQEITASLDPRHVSNVYFLLEIKLNVFMFQYKFI